MSQRQSPYTTTPAFPEPNYTQTPNNFFEMLPDMEASEVIVTLIMIRNTFGFHRNNFKMGINKLTEATGLSRNAVKAGAEAAEDRGTFRRTNPDEQTEAEWELVVGQSVPPLNESLGDGQSVTKQESINDPQVRVKESIKKVKDIKPTATPKPPTPPEILIFREVTKLYPPKANWEDVIKIVQSVSARLLRPATAADLLPFFQAWTFRGFKPTNINWTSWAVTGIIPDYKSKAQPTEPRGFDAVRKFMANHSEEVEYVNS